MRGGPAILSWHRIAVDALDPFELCTPPERFRAQLAQVCAARRVVPLEELCGTPGDDAVALTFDDGYRDALEVAAPILSELGVPATFYVTAAPLEGGAPFFWDELVHAFLAPGARPDTFEECPTATAAEREAALRRVHARSHRLPFASRQELMSRVRRWSGAIPAVPRPLDAEGVRQLARQPGCRIGAHGVNHLFLPEQDADTIAVEVRACRDALAAILDAPPASFAYPFGAWNPVVREAVRGAGFDGAVTVEQRALGANEDRWSLPRFEASRFLAGE